MRAQSGNSNRIGWCLTLLLILFSTQGSTAEPEMGVAIAPMEIKVKDNRIVYFSVYNETDNEYIITSKVVREVTKKEEHTEPPFVINPPIRLLKKRDYSKLGLIYLSGQAGGERDGKYYLMVSFIPKVPKEQSGLVMPVILSHQIPISFE